jgi:hypothetical protein
VRLAAGRRAAEAGGAVGLRAWELSICSYHQGAVAPDKKTGVRWPVLARFPSRNSTVMGGIDLRFRGYGVFQSVVVVRTPVGSSGFSAWLNGSLLEALCGVPVEAEPGAGLSWLSLEESLD